MPRANATIWTMIFGTIIFVATLYAWLYAEQHSIDSSVLWPVAVPVITALFVGQQLGAIGKAANQAVVQNKRNPRSAGRKSSNPSASQPRRYPHILPNQPNHGNNHNGNDGA